MTYSTIGELLSGLKLQLASSFENKKGAVFLLSDEYEQPIAEILSKLKSEGVFDTDDLPLDIEFKEIDGGTLTFEIAENNPSPKGKHGGVLIIHNLPLFIERVDAPKQGNTISRLCEDAFGNISGWNVILVAIGDNDYVWEKSDCVLYNKPVRMSLMYGLSDLKMAQLYEGQAKYESMLRHNEAHRKNYDESINTPAK